MNIFNNKIKAALFLSLFLSVFIGHGFTENEAYGKSGKPDWIDGDSINYPSELYLTGVGYGEERQAAEDAAYAAVSRIFQAKIESRTKELEDYFQSDTKAGTEVSRSISINSLTSVATDKVLADVTIAEVWKDEAENIIYALAVMDRQQAARSIREKISEIDNDVEFLVSEARLKKTGKIPAAARLHQAVKKLVTRATYNTDYMILNRSGSGITSKYSIVKIRQELQYLLSTGILLAIETEGPSGSKIASAVSEGLTKEGFNFLGPYNQEAADILLKIKIDFEENSTPKWQFIRWDVAIDVMDNQYGVVIGTINSHGRDAHLTLSSAKSKAVKSINKKIINQLSQEMIAIIYKKATSLKPVYADRLSRPKTSRKTPKSPFANP